MSDKKSVLGFFDEDYSRELADAIYHGESKKVVEITESLMIDLSNELVVTLCKRLRFIAEITCALERSSHMDDVEHILILINYEKNRAIKS